MYRSLLKALGVAITSSAFLAACGGGGGGKSNTSASTSTPKPAPVVALPTTVISGVFDGTNNSNQATTTFLQDDGTYFMIYSSTGNKQNFHGVLMGSGTLKGSSFSSTTGADASLIGTGTQTSPAATLSASYTEKTSFNGSYTSGSTNGSFTSTYNSSYETMPALASLVGVYKGTIATKDVREDNIELTVASDGTLSGKLPCGCQISAKLVARADGKAYDATMAFVDGDHPLTNKAVAGNVYLDAVNKQLYIVGKLSGTADGAIYVGNKL